MISGIVLALFAWGTFSGTEKSAMLIGTVPAILAGTTIVAAAVSYFVAGKKEKFVTETAFIAYILLSVTISMIMLNSGGAESPFIALWLFISVFAGAFGGLAIVPLFIAVNLYLLIEFIGGNLAKETIIAIILGGELPLILSILIWQKKSSGDETKEHAYRSLSTELSEASNKSEVVINAIAEGVIAINSGGLIELINPSAQTIIGWGRQDAVGLDYKSVLHLTDKNNQELTKANDPVFEVLNTNVSKNRNDLILVTQSGKKLNVSVMVSPIGHLNSGAIIVFHDVTKEQAQEREQAEFISTASHEMRTPVASIEGYLGLALNPATATIDDKAREFITKAHEASQHLGRLFQDLLDITKAEDGRLSSNESVVDVVAFTKDIIEGLQSKATEKGLHVFFKPEKTSSSLTGGDHAIAPVFYGNLDKDHLREVLANLIENAIKYTPQGEVVVDVVSDMEHIIISVKDSGIGIPAEDIPHLFQKFYRVDNTDTREIGGTGLGLYLCRRLAEAMKGRIWVESEYKKGSTFYLEIPRISHEEVSRLLEQAEAVTSASTTAMSPPNRRYASGADTPADPSQSAELPQVVQKGKDLNTPAEPTPEPDPEPKPEPVAATAPTPPEPIAETAPTEPTPVETSVKSTPPPPPTTETPKEATPEPTPPAPAEVTTPANTQADTAQSGIVIPPR